MIDVRVNPATVPVLIESGQRKAAMDFGRLLEPSSPRGSGEAANLARLPYAEEPRHVPMWPVLNDGVGEQEEAGGNDGRMGILEVATSDAATGACSRNAWPVPDVGATKALINAVALEVIPAGQDAGRGRGRSCPFVESDGAVLIQGMPDAQVQNAPRMQVQDAPHTQVQAGADREEWIFRPWHLQAGTGLSYRGGNFLSFPDGNTLIAATNAPSAGQGKAPLIDPAGGRIWSAPQENLPFFPAHGGAMLLIAGNSADGAKAYAPTAVGSWNKSGWIHWAQRLLRWNADAMEGDDATAWVRDFSLEADEIPSLVASLRAFSAGQGISLGRIVINGREAWAAAGYSQHMERKGDGR